MRIFQSDKGNTVVTMNDEPRRTNRPVELISTHNIEEVQARRKAEADAASAKAEVDHA